MGVTGHKDEFRVRVVVDYVDTWIPNFVIEYLRVFACSYEAKMESFKQKNGRKSRDTVSLRCKSFFKTNSGKNQWRVAMK